MTVQEFRAAMAVFGYSTDMQAKEAAGLQLAAEFHRLKEIKDRVIKMYSLEEVSPAAGQGVVGPLSTFSGKDKPSTRG